MNTTQKIIKGFAIALAVLIIGGILNLLLYVISAIVGFNIITNHETTNFEQEYKNITSIDINSIAANISIQKGDTFKVEATNISDSFSVKENKNTIIIDEEKRWFLSSNAAQVIIYVPDVVLNNIEIASGAGKIDIRDIQTNQIEIDQGAGVVEISNSVLNDAEIEGGAGELSITSSSIHNLDMDAGVGKITIEADLTGTNYIDCGVGELKLKLNNEENYRFDITKGIGNIEFNGETKNSDYQYGSGNNVIHISGGIGNIAVNFY